MDDGPHKESKIADSIAGLSAEYFVTKDDSLAQLLLNRGIQVHDFILLSFLSDQGPMSTTQLARVLGIETDRVQRSTKRLSAAGLVIRDPDSPESAAASMVSLTGRGQDIAKRIIEQLQ